MEPTQRTVEVRAATASDWWWLTRAGLSPELIGTQYHRAETPLQLLIAPTRGTPLRPGPRCIIEVDGRRAGYIGRNPLSGNLEYFLQPWARGGTGGRAIEAFLAHRRRGDRPRAFFVSHRNPRSRAALERSLERLGWTDEADVTTTDGRHGWRITVHRTEPTGSERTS
ncbi:MAG: hypothetical protein KDA97_14300 [Acidimicrobiales bacterium]|nr:hypothetical protein [Acidimicrobiales bacterium]